jgi:colicin import membrane protein
MNIAADAKPAESSIIAVVQASPELVLKNPAKFDELMVAMKAQIASFVPDVSTKASRAEIASFAFKFARTKKAIDDAGKKLNEDDQKAIKARNEVRNRIVDTLQGLQDQVRAPLDIWEEAEKKRIDYVESELSDLRGAPNYPRSFAAEDLARAISDLKARTFDTAKFQDQTDTAIALRDAAVIAMEAAHARIVKEEEDRAELERLRAEAAERKRQDDERAAKEEAERRRVAAAEAAEKRRAEAEQAEKERIAAAEKRAAENAKAEAERAHQAEIDRLNREAAEAERVRKAQADEAKRIADEDAARAADKKHRTKIMTLAALGVKTFGKVDDDTAKAIITAIVAGHIPHISIRF